jgi:hypothetical protein
LVVPEGGTARYYEAMPVAYAHDCEAAGGEHYYAVTLEFGKILGDAFNIVRQPDPSAAQQSTFLHPVIRHFVGGQLVNEHHVLEDLYGEWRKADMHIRPLLNFFAQEMHQMAVTAN